MYRRKRNIILLHTRATLIKTEFLKHIFNKLNVDFGTPLNSKHIIALLLNYTTGGHAIIIIFFPPNNYTTRDTVIYIKKKHTLYN